MNALENRDLVLDTINQLLTELEAGEVWENTTLPQFLDAFGALLRSIENSYINAGQPVPDDPWVLVAAALQGARLYE